MLDSGYKYTSRQWALISFLGLLIGVSLIFILSYSDLTNQLVLLASGKQIDYLDTVDFPDIEELDGLFPDEETDNIEVQVDVKAMIITPTYTLTPTLSPTPKTLNPAPPKITTPTPTVIVTTTLPTTIAIRDYSVPWPVSYGCSSSWLNCVPCTSGTDCRYEPNETHGFRGWACQNNNPGNIRPATFKNTIISNNGGTPPCGIRYDSRGGSYMVFTDYSTGWYALKAYIKGINKGEHPSYKSDELNIYCGDCPLTFLFSIYSPESDDKSLLTSQYAENVASRLNIPSSTYLSWVVANRLDDFINAIQMQEGFITQ